MTESAFNKDIVQNVELDETIEMVDRMVRLLDTVQKDGVFGQIVTWRDLVGFEEEVV